MTPRNQSVAIVGASNFFGAAISRRFAAEGFPSISAGATATSSPP